MQLNRSKTTVISYLALAFLGVVASWLGWYNADVRLEYSAPTLFATLMLFWIRTNPSFYANSFYKSAWRLNIVMLLLAFLPALLLRIPHGLLVF